MKSPALIIGIGKKPGGPPPPPPGMKDVPGQMGMGDDKPDDIPDPEADNDDPKTPEEFMAAICDMCRKYEESKDAEPDDDDTGGESDMDTDDTGSEYGPQA